MKLSCWQNRWFAIFAFLFIINHVTSSSPTWETIPNLDSGQLTVVNFAQTLTYMGPNTFKQDYRIYFSTFFNTNNVVPKVIISNIGYAQYLPTNSSVQVGFQIRLNIITKHNFTYTVTNFGVMTFNLRYLYLAVANEPNYFTDIKYLNFTNNSLALGNSSQRNQTIYFLNPNNLIINNNNDIQIVAFLMGFRMNCSNSRSYISINATIYNSTHYSVIMATIDMNTITQLDFSVLMFNRTAIMINYVNYVDIYRTNVVGNTQYPINSQINPNELLYRNQIGGATHIQFNLSTNLGYVGYFYTNSSANDSFLIYKNFVHRKRICKANQSKYEPQNKTCDSFCPRYTVANSANICLKCHYSCVACSLSSLPQSCLQCQASAERNLTNSSCLCNSGFFDNGTMICQLCDDLCLTCDGVGKNSCLSCRQGINRSYNSSLKECLCDVGFYENLTCRNCQSKVIGCSNCLYNSNIDNYTCLICNETLFRILSNDSSFCNCIQGYYQKFNTCHKCISLGCVSCSYNNITNQEICHLCDEANNFNLLSNHSCTCKSGYNLNINNCTLPLASVCGNGIIELQQSCDDNNVINTDGCSSQCSVELYHTCINNHTNVTYSVCYYNRQIALETKLIYKVPGSNLVRLQFQVNAPNCNIQNLKAYLQVPNQLKMFNMARLLFQKRFLQDNWQFVPSKSINYDQSTNILVITFEYNQTIDLSTKYIQFIPSNDHTSSFIKYFYSSPTSITYLQTPYNNLATIYHTKDDFNKISILKNLFIIVIVLLWTFLIFSFIFKKGAIGVECMLVFQLSYFGLLGMQTINEAWSALQLFGKYSFGYNIQIVERLQISNLRVLQIQGNIPNTLNITMIIIFILILLLAILKLIQQRFISLHLKKQNNAPPETYNTIDLNKNNVNQNNCHKQNALYVYLIDTFISFLFLTFSILIINLSFTKQKAFIGNLIEALLYFAICIISWTLIVKNRQKDSVKQISFYSILKLNKDQKQNQTLKWIIHNYYLLIFMSLCIFSLLIVFLRNFKLVIFIVAIIGSIAMIIFTWKVKQYKQRLNHIRFVLNNIILIICMVLELTACIQSSNSTQFQYVIILFLSFFILILFNSIILIANISKERKVIIQSDNYAQQMKIMDTSLAKANISIIEQVQRGLNPNSSRQMTFDRRFKNSLREDYHQARRNLLLADADESKVMQQVSENAKVLKAFKNKLRTIENQSHQNYSSNNNEEVLNLQNILDEINFSSGQKAEI